MKKFKGRKRKKSSDRRRDNPSISFTLSNTKGAP